MYEKVGYAADGQALLYELFMQTERGQQFFQLNAVMFIVCVCMLAVAAAAMLAVKSAPAPARVPGGDPSHAKLVAVLSAAFALFLFLLKNPVAFEYMDFSYYYEGEFARFKDFIANKYYLSNIHRPGYMLISWAIREWFDGAREAYIIVNLAALAASAPLAYRLMSLRMASLSAFFATIAFLISPLSVYGAFRISPYWPAAFLLILLAYSYVSFCETGAKKHAAGMAVAVFLLPFFHVMTFYGVAAFFATAAIYRKQIFAIGRGAAWLFGAVVLAALGSFLFNFSYLWFFREEILAISIPSSARLNVYIRFDGDIEYILYCLKVLPNLCVSFVSANAATAAVAWFLFAAGTAGLCIRRGHGLFFLLMGISSVAVLIVVNTINSDPVHGYPMTYRHLQMAAFFFIFPVFFSLDALGRFLSSRAGAARSAPCLIALFIFAANLPGLHAKLRSPDMTAAMNYVYDNVHEYDGVIPGNIYFMNEYHNYFLESARNKLEAESVMPRAVAPLEAQLRNFNRWVRLKRDGRVIAGNVMLNIAPFSIDSHEALLKNNFIQRVWHFDNDTRFLGTLPDYSAEYEADLRETLKNYYVIETRHLKGVSTTLYALWHEPIIQEGRDCFSIVAGENDYYFVRGTTPDIRVHSNKRSITGRTSILFFVSPGMEKARAKFFLDETAEDAELIVRENESGAEFRPMNADRARPVYSIDAKPGLNHYALTFERFGHAVYTEIQICRADGAGAPPLD